MARRNRKAKSNPGAYPKQGNLKRSPSFPAPWAFVLAGALAAAFLVYKFSGNTPNPAGSNPDLSQSANASAPNSASAPPPPPLLAAPDLVSEPAVMKVNEAVMVTVELEYDDPLPSIAEALQDVQRRHAPADNAGRTFAILDAYGMPTEDGKLHMSMHVSTEKPGGAALVFKPTGRVLWEAKIVEDADHKTVPLSQRNLTILIENGLGQGKLWTLDGSSSPVSILDATVKEKNVPLRDLWPDGSEREFTFIYSACGCPVKVMVRREGDQTVRVSDSPVIFPDDPAVVQVIRALMRW